MIVNLIQDEIWLAHGIPPPGFSHWVRLLAPYEIEVLIEPGRAIRFRAVPQDPPFWLDGSSAPAVAWSATLSPLEYGADRGGGIHDNAYAGLDEVLIGDRWVQCWLPAATADELYIAMLKATERINAFRRAKAYLAIRAYSSFGPGRTRYVSWPAFRAAYPNGVHWDEVGKESAK